jgi:TPP-dependent pyruvate/acetoin dehydrogenase alpha subunit
MDKAKLRDPIMIYSNRLREKGLLSDEQAEQMEEEVAGIVSDAVKQADSDPNPPLEARFEDVLAETYPFEPDAGGEENGHA